MQRFLNLFLMAFLMLSLVITSVIPLQTVSASRLQAPAITFTLTDALIDDGAGF